MHNELKFIYYFRGLHLFKGLCLLFLSNVQGAMSISDSRVSHKVSHILGKNQMTSALFKNESNCARILIRKKSILEQVVGTLE